MTKNEENISGSLKISLPTNEGYRIYDPLDITATISKPCDKFVIQGTFDAIYKYGHADIQGNYISGEESVTGSISIVEKE